MSKEYQEGYSAYKENNDECPYEPDSYQWSEWVMGWLKGFGEDV